MRKSTLGRVAMGPHSELKRSNHKNRIGGNFAEAAALP
jgi:hypothetical protein